MSKTFYISNLCLTGTDLPDAAVEFRPGPNLVYGASDTGKTYIFECLKYMLGGSTPPKDIGEAAGYEYIYMEIRGSEGQEFTLKRGLRGGAYIFYEAALALAMNDNQSIKKEKLSPPNASKKLLEIMGVSDKEVRKNARNEKRNLTFRDIRQLIAVDETSIVSPGSPILSGQFIHRTVEQAVFNYVLTGADSRSFITMTGKDVEAAETKGAIAVYQTMIQKLEFKLQTTADSAIAEKLELDRFDTKIADLLVTRESTTRQFNELKEQKEAAWSTGEKLGQRALNISDLTSQFEILLAHYKADIERLNFIFEGVDLFGQLKPTTCATCGQKFEPRKCEHDTEVEVSKEAISAEIRKIVSKVSDLEKTLADLNNERSTVSSALTLAKTQFDEANVKINEDLKSRLDDIGGEIQNVMIEREKTAQRALLIEELKNLIMMSKSPLKAKSDTASDLPTLSDLSLTEFCSVILQTLDKWNFKTDNSIWFDKTALDVVIGGKPRASYGKGNRAVTYGAFTISLMRYCLDGDLPHPGVVILDSPLTTHKDALVEPQQDEVQVGVDEAFFADLAACSESEQIIVIENKDPPVEFQKRIHCHYFTGQSNVGRKGFIPVS